MKENTPDPATKGIARRRLLLRGTFAAPAALTLFSGSVAARSISNCVTKQVAVPDVTPSTPTAEMGTTYVRVRLQRFSGSVDGVVKTNRYSRWVRGFDVSALQAVATNSPYLTGTSATVTQWQLYDRGVTNTTSSCSATNANLNPASAYAPPYSSAVPGHILTSGTPSEAGVVSCGTGSQTATFTSSGPTADQWVALRVNTNGDIVGVVGINSAPETSAVWQSCWSSFRVG